MKNTYTNKLTLTVVLASFAFLSLPASAGKDDIQSRMTLQVYQLQQQAKVAQASKQDSATNKVVECKRLLAQGKKC
ncbi:hypothetical protein [Methylotenera mobilis]|jgi:hypothetical protein|uniref:hypothetical protein n=1 Tax=Methylotenera mobilis TaxID=359408 RepID=UPI000371A0B8|nr:hypothetical protein [Methylotenera mobilis]MDP3008170.1 hypothetical protein [Methylococcales bacterium]PPC93290.1 MAG: hypothetical protein CTY33_08740 [Methylotenera sp.]